MTEELRSGANPDDWHEPVGDSVEGGISALHAARIADAIEADTRLTGGAPSTTPLESTGRSGVPRGYGKWGDLA